MKTKNIGDKFIKIGKEVIIFDRSTFNLIKLTAEEATKIAEFILGQDQPPKCGE